MSLATDEKKFVIKHTFKGAEFLKNGETVDGPIEKHFGVPWVIRIVRRSTALSVFLECPILTPVKSGPTDWSINTAIVGKLFEKTCEPQTNPIQNQYEHMNTSFHFYCINGIQDSFNDTNFTVEFSVQILRMTGKFEMKKLRSFDDDEAKEFSDVTLTIGNRKFWVYKGYLASHCTYFKSLLFGNFAESGKSEIELKDIDPDNFQEFLEFLYAESVIEDHSVFGILHLADFFDSKAAIRRCQEFLIYKSELPLKQKFEVAIKYNLEELKTKCISEIKTAADLQSIVPKENGQFGDVVWNELFNKAMSFVPK